ncbi:hypothetical protein EV207_103226 [Scopulibacillus darangshiensis]|uniref:DUF917 domain-containing protein n=1 Tax=Scopulibacillus darangshiensis TaxID=442528 RepID=A0A4R2PB48_9BACL|nr:DUF917 domain-containing protein [Scopulibacillus darangshiensis]TCP31341.1 hypothetical protein EV207_103226 [Scopulibacillus darangshiensis]
MRYIDEQAIEKIALGAAVLGTGGGGDPYIGKLMAKEAIRKYGHVTLISLDELRDDHLVAPVSGMGAPTVTIEKIPSEHEVTAPLETLEKVTGRKVDAVMPIEVGGINSLFPIIAAAKKGLPILDADAMGRAFPEAQMVTFHLDGFEPSPVTMADDKGNAVVLYPKDGVWSERLARVLTIEMGGSSSVCDYNLLGMDVKTSVIPDTLSLAERIGEYLLDNQVKEQLRINKMLEELKGHRLFEGKIVDIERRLSGGFTRGTATFEGIRDSYGRTFTLYFQNEHLVAKEAEQLLCTTPDLIAVLDIETGFPITTERMKYGARVVVVAFPCHDKWRTPKGIETAGPRYFGYDFDYQPVGELLKER